MSGFTDSLLDYATLISLYMLSACFLLTIARVIIGPTLPDRILALDMLVATAIGYIAVIGIRTGFALYVDIAIALGLVGFLATIAFARFVMMRGHVGDDEDADEEATGTSKDIRRHVKEEPLL